MNEWIKAGIYVISGFTAICVGGLIGTIIMIKYIVPIIL